MPQNFDPLPQKGDESESKPSGTEDLCKQTLNASLIYYRPPALELCLLLHCCSISSFLLSSTRVPGTSVDQIYILFDHQFSILDGTQSN